MVSQMRPGSKLVAVAAVAAAGALMLAGCAAGQQAQTAQVTPVIDGVNATSGTLGIRDAGIAAPDSSPSYATGGSATLQLDIVNTGTAADTLTTVSSPAAGSAVIGAASSSSAASSGSSDSVSATASASGASSSASAAPTASSAATSGSASPSSSASSGPAGGKSVALQIPALTSVPVGYDTNNATITLSNLTAALYPSQTVTVTFTFASGATITANLPVKQTTGSVSAPTVDVSPTSEN